MTVPDIVPTIPIGSSAELAIGIVINEVADTLHIDPLPAEPQATAVPYINTSVPAVMVVPDTVQATAYWNVSEIFLYDTTNKEADNTHIFTQSLLFIAVDITCSVQTVGVNLLNVTILAYILSSEDFLYATTTLSSDIYSHCIIL